MPEEQVALRIVRGVKHPHHWLWLLEVDCGSVLWPQWSQRQGRFPTGLLLGAVAVTCT